MVYELITPYVGADTFCVNERNEVCLIRRADNGLWATPGGCHDLGETAAECAAREFREETGLIVRITALLGVFSSLRYGDGTGMNRGREFCHLLFRGELIGGIEATSDETTAVGWFAEDALPPLAPGHEARIRHAYAMLHDAALPPHYE